ncbi:MAG: hypothetical protein QG656_1298 [Candidatus Hydrogenedentes bacterium]|nr:hypothetical protein [Candidatus Hydrogenedentota bacterium]
MISVSFTMGLDEILARACNYYQTSAVLRSEIRNARLFFGAVVLIYIGFLMGDLVGALVCLILAVLWVMFFPRYTTHLVRKSIRRQLHDPSCESLFGRYSIVLSDEGIESNGPNSRCTYNWRAVSRVVLTGDYLFIFRDCDQGWTIPRSEVDDATIQSLKEYVESRMNKST